MQIYGNIARITIRPDQIEDAWLDPQEQRIHFEFLQYGNDWISATIPVDPAKFLRMIGIAVMGDMISIEKDIEYGIHESVHVNDYLQYASYEYDHLIQYIIQHYETDQKSV